MDPFTAFGVGLEALASVDALQGKSRATRQAWALAKQQQLMREQDIALQKQFAQQGIRWRVEDAKKAGLHPLAALGAGGATYSPTAYSVGGAGDSGPSPFEVFSGMGQNLTRAVASTMTQEEKAFKALQLESTRLDVEGKAIENQIRSSQLRQLNMPAPSMAGSDNFLPGQGNSPLVLNKPLERVVSAPGRPAQEAGWRPDVAYSRTDTGLTPVVPSSLSESLEDDIIGKLMWRVRNQLLPNFGKGGKPPKSMLPKGSRQWKWNHWRQEFQPSK